MQPQLALESQDVPKENSTLVRIFPSTPALGYVPKLRLSSKSKSFSKMSKTMGLVARLDAYNTGDNQTRVSKLLGYLLIPHVGFFFGVPTALFSQTCTSTASGAWKPLSKKDGCHAGCLR